MEIEVTEKKKVNVSQAQCQYIMIQTMKQIADWKDGMWLDMSSKQMMQTVTYHGSHSFDDDKVVRDATEMDLAVHFFIGVLNKKQQAEVKKNTIAFPVPS